MQHRRIGEMGLSRVEEMMIPLIEAEKMFPSFGDETLAEHNWLSPTYYDTNSKRLLMSIHSWVLRTKHHTVLIDTCFGNHRNRPGFRDGHQLDTPWLANLAAAGVKPQDVDIVMCTHLHIDHVGWNTKLENGRYVPTFPNARYIFSKRDFDYYDADNKRDPKRRAQHGAFDDAVLPIVEAGKALLIDGDFDIDDQLGIRHYPGHTPGSIALEAASQGERGLFSGDILHHPIQVWHPEWNSAFCVDPPNAAKSRRKVLEHCVEHGSLLLPAHFAAPHCGHVHQQGDGFRFHFAPE